MKTIQDRIEEIIKGSSKTIRVEYERRLGKGLKSIPEYSAFKAEVVATVKTLARNTGSQGKEKKKFDESVELAIKRLIEGIDAKLEKILDSDYSLLKGKQGTC